MDKRKIVVPGETIITGSEFLPGDGTRREGDDIVSSKYGLADVSDKLIRIIPLSGGYVPRRGNVIVGVVEGIHAKGWAINYGGYDRAFLLVSEVPRYVNRGELQEHFDFGEVVAAKVIDAEGGSLTVTVKGRGLGKLFKGQLKEVNANKVPRVIGKEGSMVRLIKDATGTAINVGQNGVIWIKGDKIEDELNAIKIIDFVCENSSITGLTEKTEEYIKKDLKLEIKQNGKESEPKIGDSAEDNDKE